MGQLFSGLLVQQCAIFRRKDGTDRLGQPKDEYELHATVKCRCTASQGGRQNNDRMTDVVQTTHVLFLEPDVDIGEDDHVTVTDPGGITFVEDAIVHLVRYPVDSTKVHHIEAELSTQRAAV